MKIKQTVMIAAVLLGFAGLFVAPAPTAYAGKCAGVETSIINCDDSSLGTCSDGSKPVNATCPNPKDPTKPAKYIPPSDLTKSGIWSLLMLGINILTAGVGIAAVAGIVWGSALFMTASDNAEQVRKARMVIWNTVIGVVVYAAMYSFLNFIIPGGLFN